MKAGFIITAILIPTFNIIVIMIAVLLDLSPMITIAPCAIGSILFAMVGYKTVVEPFLDTYKDMEETVDEIRKLDEERSEFMSAIAEAYDNPVEIIKKNASELDRMGVAEDAAKLSQDALSRQLAKENSGRFDKYYVNDKKKREEEEKSSVIDPITYRGEVVKKSLDDMIINATKIQHLTKDIMLLADIQTKHHVAQGGRIVIENALNDIFEDYDRMLKEKGIEVEIELEEGLYIEGAEERFKILIGKIIENAIIYSKKGGKIFITTDEVSGYVFVNIRDQGIGIPTPEIPSIFEKFYRVKRLDDPNPNAAGLGLAIVKHVAELMDAEIRVKSTYNVGSTFSVIFKRGVSE